MKIELLDEAVADLLAGFDFYERQVPGLGDYFCDSIFSDLESLQIYGGIHPIHFGFHRLALQTVPLRDLLPS